MICYQCGSQLGSGRYCLRCGADVALYRKIVRISNAYYNAGLEKAKVRDLTGAIECLERSLQFDKRNTNARNLLGLIYYEIGEVVEAICQWVVSTNLRQENNLASSYLEQVQGAKAELESMNQATKKFNLALDYAVHGKEDLAIIQLKGVIAQYPHMVKAHQLLALLYIGEEDYAKASKVLKSALHIDRGNTYCLKYTREIRGKSTRQPKVVAVEEQAARIAQADVLVPEYREHSGALRFIMGAVAGVLITLLMWIGLVMPAQRRQASADQNQLAISYYEQIDSLKGQVSQLNTQVSGLESTSAQLQAQLDAYSGEGGMLPAYENLSQMLVLFQEENWDEMLTLYETVSRDQVDSDAYRALYDYMDVLIKDQVASRIYDQARVLLDEFLYTDALPILERVLQINPDYVDAIYQIAQICVRRENVEGAKQYYTDIINRFPESSYVAEAQAYVDTH